MRGIPVEPRIIGLITPEVFYDNTFHHIDDIQMCDALEIRYDLFENPLEWKNIGASVRESFPKKEIIATVRLERDGGAFSSALIEKRNILITELLLLGQWNWLDIEYEQRHILPEIIKAARSVQTQVITSHHNFVGAYAVETYELMGIEMALAGSDAIKFAVMAQTDEDIDALYTFVTANKERSIPLPLFSVFSMGERGKETRKSMPTKGAPYTYSFFGDTAPVSGQISVKEMAKFLNKSK